MVAGAEDADGGVVGLRLSGVEGHVAWMDGLGRHIGLNDQDFLIVVVGRIVAR